jgi:membrane protease YdiL (CAAX protease family)
MERKITITGVNIVLFVFTVLYLIFQLILIGLSLIYGEGYLQNNIYRILLINQYVIILIPVLGYVFFKKLNLKEVFRLNKLGILPALIILFLSFPAQLVGNMLNSVMVYLLQFIGDIPSNPIPVPDNLRDLAVGIAVIAVSPAICEELLHRGLLLKAYEKRGSIKALVITSIIFGIFHFDITNLLGATFLGLLIGYYVIKTNSIFAGMLAHFLNNAIYVFLQYFLRNRPAPDKIIRITSEELSASVIYGFAGLVAIGLLLMLFRKLTEGKYKLIPPISIIKKDIVSIISHWPIIVLLVIYLCITGLLLFTIFLNGFSGL